MLSFHRLARALLGTVLLAASWHAVADISLSSQRALVVDEATGQVLLEKNSQEAAPMASLTKLLTAMVVLDAKQDPLELLLVDPADLDTLKHTHSGVPPGTVLPRSKLLELALLASDNHAAAALARQYPGGMAAFQSAMQTKIAALKLEHTVVVEPTGLSPANRSNAADLAVVLAAATAYPEISQATSQADSSWTRGTKTTEVRNTNRLVGRPGWDILLSKTGFTNEAGRCLVMRLRMATRTVFVILMDAAAGTQRTLDALNVQRWLTGQAVLTVLPAEFLPQVKAGKGAKGAKAAGTRERARKVVRGRKHKA